MSERTSGLYRLVGMPKFYQAFQNLLGAKAGRQRLVNEYIKPKPNDRILDLGCGSAAILSDLPGDVSYVGIDHNDRHITKAQESFGERGVFLAGNFDQAGDYTDQPFDIVLALGLLHHLDDAQVNSILQLAKAALVPGGRFVTIDPAFAVKQSKIARFLISNDSGQNVRTANEYLALSKKVFPQVKIFVRDDLLTIPYTHCLMIHSNIVE